jgi:hypothetical protein
MHSKIATEAKATLLAATQRLTPESRLNAFLEQCRLMMELRHAGRELQSRPLMALPCSRRRRTKSAL